MSARQPQRPQAETTDRRIGRLVRDVDVPPGLEERILARLASTETSDASSTIGIVNPHPPRSRRRWIARAGATFAACAAGMAIAWLLWPDRTDDFDSERIMILARSMNEPWGADAGSSIAEKAPPAKYEAGPYVMLNAETRWRPIDRGFAGRTGVAYDVTLRDRQHARLFVVDLRPSRGAPEFRGLPHAPMHGILSTGGVTTSAWTDGSRVYVLVVEGNENALRAFLRHPGTMA